MCVEGDCFPRVDAREDTSPDTSVDSSMSDGAIDSAVSVDGAVDSGDDTGCTFGSCPDGERCDATGTCVAERDDCGGACGPGTTCVDGRCVSEPCGGACAIGTICRDGVCVPEGACGGGCPAGQLCVDDRCQVDGDGDGVVASADCNDADASVRPGATESCNGIDQDCDDRVDEGATCRGCAQRNREGRSYLFCGTVRSWIAARDNCRSRGAYDLLKVDGRAEDDWALNQVRTLDASVHWWFGLNDRASEGAYVWADGTPARYVNWSEGQPDDFRMNEDCAHLNRTLTPPGDFLWNDNRCDFEQKYVCESTP